MECSKKAVRGGIPHTWTCRISSCCPTVKAVRVRKDSSTTTKIQVVFGASAKSTTGDGWPNNHPPAPAGHYRTKYCQDFKLLDGVVQ